MTINIFSLSKIERLKLIGRCIQAVTGVAGGSLILIEGHPYATIVVLSIGALANEVVSFIKEKENQINNSKPEETVIM